jgi:hypothetical protein
MFLMIRTTHNIGGSVINPSVRQCIVIAFLLACLTNLAILFWLDDVSELPMELQSSRPPASHPGLPLDPTPIIVPPA